MSFKVGYIDESDIDVRSFKRSVRLRSNTKFEVVTIEPKPDLFETVETILDSNLDAIVADFRLSEENPTIHYNGSMVVQEVLKIREHFPAFILTSFEDDAIDNGFDVNIVYEKVSIQTSSKFFDKVIVQIKKYKHLLESSESRLIDLLAVSQIRELSVSEEMELIDLDSILERSVDRKSAIPEGLKSLTNDHRLSNLIKKTDELIEKIKRS